jgi:DNA-binding CsgD family transcriptional regulator
MSTLTAREWEVLYGISHGHTTRQIAHQMGIRPLTVAWYRKRIHRQLGVTNSAAAVSAGYQLGLLP